MDLFMKENKLRGLFLVTGIVLGIGAAAISPKLLIFLLAALGFAVFTFYRLDIFMALFILGMMAIPHDYWNNMLITLAALFFTGVYTLQWAHGKRPGIDLKYLAPSLVLYVAFCLLSVFTGFGKTDSLRVFVIFFSCVIFTVLLPNVIRDSKTLDLFIILITIAITLTALFGLYQYAMGIEIKSEFTDLVQNQGLARLFSTMANPNNDAEVWAMFLPYAIALCILTKDDMKKILLAGMILICLLALALTYSRTSYIALIAAAAAFILLVEPRLVPVGILAFILVIPFIPSSITARISTLGKDTSSKYRFYIWEGVLRVIKNYWTQGIGMGPTAFATIYRAYAHPNAGPVMHSHNILLNTWVETGIGGVITLFAYFIRLCKDSVSTVISPMNVRYKYFAAAGAASFVAFFIFGLAEYVWFYPRVMLSFWISMGLIHTVYRLNNEGEKQ